SVRVGVERARVLQLRAFLHVELPRRTATQADRDGSVIHQRHTASQRQQRTARSVDRAARTGLHHKPASTTHRRAAIRRQRRIDIKLLCKAESAAAKGERAYV